MKKIEKLTPAQQELLPKIRDEWLSRGLSTQPANRPEAERGVKLAYAAANLPAPQFIIWVDSPYAGAFAQAIAPDIIVRAMTAVGAKAPAQVWAQVGAQVGAQVRAQVGAQVRDQVGAQVRDQVGAQVGAQVRAQVWAQVGAQVGAQVRDQVRAQVRDQVRAQVGAQVWDQVRDQVGAQVRDQVRAQVGAQVWDQVRDQVGAQVWDQVRDQVGDQVRDQVWDQVRDQVWDQVRDQVGAQVGAQVGENLNKWTEGLNDYYYYGGAYYASWIDAMKQLGVDGLSPWDGQTVVAGNAFWWWCFKGFAVISERPSELHRDGQNRLHNESGYAIRWPDGWGFHSWHGTRVPEWVVENPTPEQIFAETNTEIRRCAIESLGWGEFIESSGMTPVSASLPDPGNEPHTLTLYDLPKDLQGMYAEPARILLCTNGTVERDGTRHRYGLIVPAKHNDPIAAAADLYGWPVDAYRKLEVRR
jgi:hypothetical protein